MSICSSHLMLQLRNTLGIMTLFCLAIIYIIWSSTGEYSRTFSTAAVTINDSMYVCRESFDDTRTNLIQRTADELDALPIIYFVTPTYPRREQFAELIRLGQTLMHIPRIHWIVANDVDSCNTYLDELLNRLGMPYTHISSPMPDVYRSHSLIPRGVANRRAAINWIRKNGKKPGVLYFGDDDNTFDLKLFDEIRYTKRVSMFPVGLIGLYAVSTPVIENGQVIGFFDSWPAMRAWPVDMAGFAVSLDYLENSPNATMPYKAGFEEDEFLKSIGLKLDEIEPKANNCSEILVWHTQTKKDKVPVIHIDSHIADSKDVSLGAILRQLQGMGVSRVSSVSGVKANIIKDGKAEAIHKVIKPNLIG